MKVLVLSDLHRECAPFDVAQAPEVDAVLLAGDIQAPGEAAMRWMLTCSALRDKVVIFVPGNHEYYGGHMGTVLARMRAMADRSHVHVLDGDALCWEGVRFLGATLWTDFGLALETPQGPVSDPARAMRAAALGLADYLLIQTGNLGCDGLAGVERVLRPQDTAQRHAAQRAWLASQLAAPFAGRTVVVTHHAPHRGSLAPRFASDPLSAAFVNALPDAFFDVPALWVHGHTHDRFDYVVRNTRVVCNPRGYGTARQAECARFDPHWVIEI